jgi:tetratricopeptide (TPR) repeat protein
LTAAEKRSMEVKATRPRREPGEVRPVTPPPAWEREEWVDQGSLRAEAEDAARRAAAEPVRSNKRRASMDLAPEVSEELAAAAPAQRMARYQERLATAADALDRGRYDDARRMVQPVLRDLPDVSFAHEIAGLAWYRTGQWRKAAAELELVRQLNGSVQHHAVLMDCYRALRRYHEVEVLWRELREASPEPPLMAEGRIVAAGALADQGDLAGALKAMQKGLDVPKKPREHHLRQWYVLGDLFDRSGDVIKARRYFSLVAEHDREFADVVERLRTLGR